MKIKTSITLSEDLLEDIDKEARELKKPRSEFIEDALSAFLKHLHLEEQNRKDLEIFNRKTASINKEVADVLEFQSGLFTE